MAVTLPTGGFEELDIPPDLGIARARTIGSLVVTSRGSDPVVRGKMTTGKLSLAERQDWEAFLVDAMDRNLRVDFVHPRHRTPISYTLDSLPFAGTGSAIEFPDLRTMSASGLPVDLMLKRGDRVGIEQSGMKLCRWMRADTTVASTTDQDLPLTPRLPIGVFSAGATIRLLDPVMRFLVTGIDTMAERYEQTPISFSVEEVLS